MDILNDGHDAPARGGEDRDLQRASHPVPEGDALDPVTLERMVRAITASGKYKIVERMERRPRYRPPCEGPIKTAVFVDVETTGLEETDRIIQIAMVPFEFDADGR